ncbi:Gfo/Idh/MocA family protein [Actinokineospora guangxiensis]|uniref:Gfo/Idh/MocA family protein n=1 Tax=Actinokineospora guangxiensis TaxID=1490288 RepID=A0ABW0EVT9_9PSEU
MNGVTGRMGYRQHLLRSILAIRDDGGIPMPDGDRLVPVPILVGRDTAKVSAIAARHDIASWTTDLDTALSDDTAEVYFDAQITSVREKSVLAAIAAGKHIYVEKPTADTLDGALALARAAAAAGVRSGVVHDKLFLPGLLKLGRLIEGGFFGRVLSVRGDFGYWVFEGDWQPAQRPSWNYKAEEGGGIVVDMFAHWSYVLGELFGAVEAVTARAVTHIPHRWDEKGEAYEATADDAAYAIFELAGGVIAQFNSSWCTRVDREELLRIQVDGTHGSAVAGLTGCKVQHRSATPKPTWNPDVPNGEDFREQWAEVPDNQPAGNGFRAQWERFLREVRLGQDHPFDFLAGARGVQLANLGLESSARGARLTVPELVL